MTAEVIPGSLSGNDIPFMARIVCVADSFDAMTSDRAYRPRFSVSKALEELANCKGTQFDPAMVDAFLTAMEANKEQVKKDLGLEY